MTLSEAIEDWWQTNSPKGIVLFLVPPDSTFMSNDRRVQAVFFEPSTASWLGDVFDTYLEIKRADRLERLEAGDPEFFPKLERFFSESR
jgi:hypothetical protein